jgi:hypothetical protein
MNDNLENRILNMLIALEECEVKQRKAIIEDLDTLHIIQDALIYYLEGKFNDNRICTSDDVVSDN